MKSLLACVGLALIGGCADTDDRPETLAFITETILTPTCARAECHSAMKRQFNYSFSTIADAQLSLAGGQLDDNGNFVPNPIPAIPLIVPCSSLPCDSTTNNFLVQVITDVDTFKNRMPYDASMPNGDIELIINWIRDGADGFVPLPARVGH